MAALPANAYAHPDEAGVGSISCSSAGNCTAVGTYWVNRTVGEPADSEGLLLTETAGHWSAGVEAVLPANANAQGQFQSVRLTSVSCSSAGNCGAVGAYTDDSGYPQGLLLTETAGQWSTGVEAALPANTDYVVSLSSISCTSAGNCSAVGVYGDKSIPYGHPGYQEGVLLTETAGSWATGVEVALPAGAYAIDSLGSVSCGSAGNCSAAGTYTTSVGAGYTKGLLVTQTDGSWGPGVEPPLPPDAVEGVEDSAAVSSVSCASAGNCTAVGFYNGAEYEYDCDKYTCADAFLADGWLLTETDGSWSADAAPALPDPAVALESLTSVSCASPGNCSAVGSYVEDDTADPPDEEGLLLTETDGHWATGVKAVFASGYGDWPESVSCVSPGNCGAVTFNGNLLTQTAGTWATGVHASVPASATEGSALSSVSCTPDGSCGAAGSYYPSNGSEGLLIGGTPPAVELDVSTKGPGSGSVSSDVGGIDCGSTCSASVDAGTAVTLTATPSPGSRFSGWSGGGCSGTGSCSPDTVISKQTVTASFSFLPWGSAAAVPGASALNVGGSAQVTSISCAGAKTCAAGGYYRDGSGYQPFVADESSGVWGNATRVPRIGALNGGNNAQVTSISCGSPGNCAAGGYYRDSTGGYQAFAVSKANGLWGNAVEVPGTAALNGGNNARVTSISCAGPGNCAAGGTYHSAAGSQQVFVVNEKNGRWGKAIELPGTAALNVGRNASLNAISCGAPGKCAAGGSYRDGKGGFQAFAVREKSGVWDKALKVPTKAALNVGGNAQVTAVSCATGKSCAAGGTYKDGSGHTQAFVVNGTTGASGNWVWGRAIIVPGTAAALHVSGFAQLTSISCAGAGNCSAAGAYSGPHGNQAFVVSSIDGFWGKATEVPGIASLASTSAAIAISCARVGNCAVTGSDDTWPYVFAAVETNGVWSNAASLFGLNALAVSGSPQVTSISCAKPAGTCAIGGGYDDSSSYAQPFVTAP